MITKRKIAALATAAAAVVAMTATTAGAAEPTGREFAGHVRMMAQSDIEVRDCFRTRDPHG